MSDLNDPRVLFAAERTLLAWVRTGITAIGLGFIVARFGLFLRIVHTGADSHDTLASSLIGIALILVGSALCLLAVRQFRRLVQTLKPAEIPAGYSLLLTSGTGYVFTALGVALAIYLGFLAL